MHHLLVISFVTICLLFPNIFAKKQKETIDVPFVIDGKGDMIIEVGGVKFSLNSKQVLKFNDGESKTEIDFGSPTPEELKNKKGTRRLTEIDNKYLILNKQLPISHIMLTLVN
uniref:Uncharacterized protein n=1 Tax=Schistosoma haematobium TaxID=6185 RepID=A0A094ZWA5_SCHHA